jgi:hypothetical protein
MEFLDGETLKHRIESVPLKADSLPDVGGQIADGPDTAHSQRNTQLTSSREVRTCPRKTAILPFPPLAS